jgi:ribosomal protein S27E
MGSSDEHRVRGVAHGWGRNLRVQCSACGGETRVDRKADDVPRCRGCGARVNDSLVAVVRRRPIRIAGFLAAAVVVAVMAANRSSDVTSKISAAAGHKETSCQENRYAEAIAPNPKEKVYVCRSDDVAEERNGEFKVSSVTEFLGSSGAQLAQATRRV